MSDTEKYVYVLGLQGGCIYVGSTQDVLARLDEYKSNYKKKCPRWVKNHPILKLISVIPVNTLETKVEFKEEEVVTKMMMEYGIDKVRGGSYCNNVLTIPQKDELTRRLRMMNGQCVVCGGTGHFAVNCKNKKSDPSPKETEPPKKSRCERCFRYGHTISKCWAKRYENKEEISDDDEESEDDEDDDDDDECSSSDAWSTESRQNNIFNKKQKFY